ncbi:OmpW/AlkL family protein [Halomonas koreensis]|uniref:OmpW family outer membrane protein n=1 Tax=Halomonas koreensis TaxID=245385 RepID=A0ABU1G5D2_9GAMM|nr:OmpW family outer membrane protein [Halomonas koreensis]MDR5867728.1 OmpW family outer membrane protein [Halomonas koreensis]
MRRTLLSTLIIATGLAASSQALAYGAGDFFTRAGVAKVDPKGDNGTLDTALGDLDVDVQDENGFAFTLGYRFTDKLGVELLAAEPFSHDITLDAGGGTEVGAATDHLPPTLTLQYYPFGGTQSRVQPYAGLGVNYTRFSDEEIDLAGADLELDDSWGAAAQLGVDLLIDEHWALNAAAWYLDIDTDASLNGDDIGTVEIDPLVVMGGVSFRF